MADYTVDQLYAKLDRADTAGDAEAARVIADEIRRVEGAQPSAAYRATAPKAPTPEQLAAQAERRRMTTAQREAAAERSAQIPDRDRT